MAKVASRSHGGLPKPPQLTANPFDSDDDDVATTSSNTTSRSSTRYSNPFDDDSKSHLQKTSRTASDPQVLKSSNPFDDDYSPLKSSKSGGMGNKIKPSHSDSSINTSNPFEDNFQDDLNPKSRGDSILDTGSLFADEEGAQKPGKPAKERKSRTRAFASKIAEGGSRIKEGAASAASSLSSVKLPSMSSGSFYGDERSSSKRGKAKKNSVDLFGEPDLVQNNYFSHEDERRFETQTVEELEQYAVTKSEDTTSSIKNAIKIATDTQEIAKTTLETLHEQGKQIHRTHEKAVHVDEELSRGEKLLGSLGGMFTMTWKPKKAHKITGPQVNPDQFKRRNHLGERGDLGLSGGEAASRSRPQVSSGMSSAQAQLAMEKNTQDEALSDLSNVLGQLKGMTLDMGNEIDRQNGDLDRMHDDVTELNSRVKGANNRTRRLLGR